jgi:ferredoxin
MTTDSDVLSYLNDLQSPQREIVTAIRALILQVDGDIDEAIRWGTLTFTRFGKVCSIKLTETHVILTFFDDITLTHPWPTLKRVGAKVRSIRLQRLDDLKPEALTALVSQAIEINRKRVELTRQATRSVRSLLPKGRPVWFVNLIKHYFPQRFSIARVTHWPIIRHIVDAMLFKGDETIYLPKDNVVQDNDRVIQINEAIAPPEEMVLPSRAVEHFVERAEHIWIMDACFCRDANDCDDYPHELGCIFLGEAVLEMNPKLGRMATKEEALEHLRRSREAGLVHMIGKNKIDHFWTGAGPGDKLFTICNCCPCCCLWRVVPYLGPESSANVHKMPGVEVRVTEACVGCGACTNDVCFVDAIRLEDGRAFISEQCVGCGRCVDVCPTGAIQLTVEDTGYVDATIARLEDLVDVT